MLLDIVPSSLNSKRNFLLVRNIYITKICAPNFNPKRVTALAVNPRRIRKIFWHKILQVHWLKWLGICCCYGHTLGLRGSINSGWGQFRSFWWQRGRLLRSRRECLDFTTILSSLYAQLPSIWLMLYVRYSTQWTRLLNFEIGLGIWFESKNSN